MLCTPDCFRSHRPAILLFSSGPCNFSTRPSYHSLRWFLVSPLSFLVSPLWFIWTVLPDVASQSSYRSSVLCVALVFYPFSWPPLSLLRVIQAITHDTDFSGSISKVENILVAGFQIPKIGDICACSTTITDRIATYKI